MSVLSPLSGLFAEHLGHPSLPSLAPAEAESGGAGQPAARQRLAQGVGQGKGDCREGGACATDGMSTGSHSYDLSRVYRP